MVSQRKLLRYISKHPNCSYSDISKDLFDNDVKIASFEIIRNKEYIIGEGTYSFDNEGSAIKTIDNISINSLGQQKLEQWFNEKWRFRIPLIFSIIAIIVAIVSAYFTYLQI